MKKFLKKYIIELIGVIFIAVPAILFHDVTRSGMEGLERYAILIACGVFATIGMKIIQKAAKCEK